MFKLFHITKTHRQFTHFRLIFRLSWFSQTVVHFSSVQDQNNLRMLCVHPLSRFLMFVMQSVVTPLKTLERPHKILQLFTPRTIFYTEDSHRPITFDVDQQRIRMF